MKKNINLDNFQLIKMQKEYSKMFIPKIDDYIKNLNTIISSVEINGYGMPLLVQNQIYANLMEVRQILSTLSINKPITPHHNPPTTNPLILLYNLNTFLQSINKYTFKSPFYILLNKSSNLIISSMDKILKYFLKINKK